MFQALEFIAITVSLDFTQAWTVAGLTAGFALALFLANRRGIGLLDSVQRMCIALPFLLAGGKLAYLWEHGSSWSQADVFGPGYSLYGSFAAVVAVWSFWRLIERFPLLSFLDCITPGAALALVLGRVGCFLRGCCGGTICDLPWGVRYPAGTLVHLSQVALGLIDQHAPASLPVHPTQLYEALFAGLFLIGLLYLWSRHSSNGSVFFAGMIGYASLRFLIEPIRIQTTGFRLLDLWTMAQSISILLFAAGVLGIIFTRKRRQKRSDKSDS